jgi:hypothetical protein
MRERLLDFIDPDRSMALACLAQGRDMQYMKALRDKRGDPIRDAPPQAVKIDTTFLFRGARP